MKLFTWLKIGKRWLGSALEEYPVLFTMTFDWSQGVCFHKRREPVLAESQRTDVEVCETEQGIRYPAGSSKGIGGYRCPELRKI